MPDLALELSADGVDLRFEAGDLVLSETLLEPVLVSLFSDARAPEGEELPDFSGDPRGWWAEEVGDEHGSLLWLLERERLVPETAALAQTYAQRALAWMIAEGIASEVDVLATIERPEGDTGPDGQLCITVALTRGSSSAWETAWEATRTTDWAAERWRVNLLLR